MTSQTTSNQGKKNSGLTWWTWIMFIVIMFFGIVGRFYDLSDAPLDFHPTRQLRSMLIARGMYYRTLDDVSPEKQQIAINQMNAEGQIEPPIMEQLTAWGYKLVGSDDLRVPRVISIFFWILGGVGLFLLLKKMISEWQAAIVGLAYFMVLPYALYASRSFQPEPLLTASIIWAWWGMLKWSEKKNWQWTIISGLLAGFAIFVKSPALFFIIPAWLGLILAEPGLVKALRTPKVWIIVLLTILPYAIYHIYGMYIDGFLQGQMSLRFFPDLWKDPFHYLSWERMLASTLGIEFFLAGLVGIVLIRQKQFRIMFLGVWLGCFLYGMTFSYHIVTHDYYQVPFVPAVAVGLAALAGAIFNKIPGKKSLFYGTLTVVMLFWMAVNFWDARMTLKHARYQDEPKFWASLGEKLGDRSVVSLTEDYGTRLSYWGWKPTTNWMSMGDIIYRQLGGQEVDTRSLLLQAVEGKDLFLVTDFEELERQVEVKDWLYQNYAVMDQSERYLVFDLNHPLQIQDVNP